MITRIHGDAGGETHLSEYALPAAQHDEAGALVMRGLLDVPAHRLGIYDMAGHQAESDFHATDTCKVIVVLRGAFEIIAGDGDRRTFGPGDCLVTDDRGTRGHAFADVGTEPLLTVITELEPTWRPR